MRFQLGLAGGPVPRDPRAVTPALADRLRGLGVTALVTHFFALPPEEIVRGEAQRVRAVLAAAGIQVVQATGYNPHLGHRDGSLRRAGLARLRRAFDAARALGAEMVITGCGSHHPTHFYGPSPENHTPAARERLVASLRQAATWAEETGVLLALECHVLTTLDPPEQVRAILDAVGSPWVKVNFDPVNLLGDLPTLWANGAAMRRMWEVIGPHYAPSAHVKDVVAQPELVLHISEAPPGQGVLDYGAFFAVARGLGEGAALIVEHLPADQVEAALAFVRAEAARHGVSFR